MRPKARTVAIIAPDFPPSSLPSSIRARLFATHLEEFGWHPVVITVLAKHYTRTIDPDNERLLPAGLEVVHTEALSPRWARRLGISDIGLLGLWHLWRAIGNLCRTRKVDLLFVTVPPNLPMVLGRLAWERYGVPYVVDYQDPWITETYWQMPRSERPPKWALVYALSRMLEPFAIRRASHITGVSDGTTSGVLQHYPEIAKAGATTLPFGAEPGDFDFLRTHPRVNSCFDPTDGKLHIVYAGVCIPGMNPALRCLFAGLRLLREKDPALAASARLHFVGTSYAPTDAGKRVLPIAEEHGVADLVDEVTARVAYLDALQILLDATGLLILGTSEQHYTASKIYPYALAERPIFAILHEKSSAVANLAAMTAARIITFGDDGPGDDQTKEAAAELEGLLCEKGRAIHADLTGHTARDMTRQLATVFDKAIGAGGGQ